jgi:cystathionine beta-lyase/cystathionine gamma-synthase
MKEHMLVSMEVARFLETNPRIEKIFFPRKKNLIYNL